MHLKIFFLEKINSLISILFHFCGRGFESHQRQSFFQNWISIFLSLLHNQQIKKHIFVRFNTSWYITNNLDSFLSFLIIFEQKTYAETNQKKKKFCLLWDLISGPLALQFTALPTELPWQEEKLRKKFTKCCI